MNQTHLFWSFLQVLTTLRYEALMDHYGDLATPMSLLNEEFLRQLGCRGDTVERVMTRLRVFDAHAYESELHERGIGIVCIHDQPYPKRLSQVADAPIFLTYRGDISLLNEPCIGMVGTRRMSTYGRRVVRALVPQLAAAGVVTVSGLANGIDSEVALQTITAGGRTVAVLGHGMGRLSPPSKVALADRIVASGGLVLSEFPLDFPADKYTFPSRNRIIAGVSIGTVVLEAPEKSGALITAEIASGYGREVFAVPGQIFDPNFVGCHRLVRAKQAILITSVTDILESLGVVAPPLGERLAYRPRNSDEDAVLKALTTMPQSVDDLVERSGLDARAVGVSLSMMELSDAARHLGEGMWVKN